MSRMMTVLGLVAVLAGGVLAAAGQSATDKSVVADARAAVAARDFARGDSLLNEYRSVRGVTPELIEALSWLARGAFAAKELDKASQYAAETRTLAVAALESRRLDEDAHLQTALGAAIEVEALVRAARGERANAVYFLERDLERYANTPIHMRIQKNINLLSLEGQPAPSLEAREYIGRRVPSFDQLRGKAVLLFFWAHWCPDCKAQGPIHREARREVPCAGPSARCAHPAIRVHRGRPGRDAGGGTAAHRSGA